MSCEILTVAEMYEADRLAMIGGIDGLTLMEAAGHGVALAVRRHWSRRPVVVLCGPGNNGGDGFVVARLLAARNWPVRVALLGDVAALKGDAAVNAGRWHGPVEPLSLQALDGAALVIDALFGAGLTRPLDGVAKAVIDEMGRRRLPCLAIDVPSGIDGNSGAVRGTAPRAEMTVTFFRKKPAHVLQPGRALCGKVVVVDIGIPQAVLDTIRPRCFENDPALWAANVPRPEALAHKYSRGHVLMAGGAMMTGATRLAALAARRVGAGLVTIAAPDETRSVYQGAEAGNIVQRLHDFPAMLQDRRKNVVLVGPGGGRGAAMRHRVLASLAAGKACVIDADAITSFADGELAEDLFRRTWPSCIFTPHEGEFSKLFDFAGDKISRAQRAARKAGSVMLLKGSDTVIANPAGRVVINTHAPAWLATAGTGDVLAGMVAGLLAQGMPAFEASCAAVWLHGAAADTIGPGLIAEDLPNALPQILAEFYSV